MPFKQKLSFRTQLALHELIAKVKDIATEAGDGGWTATWTGEFLLSYNDDRRYPRLIAAFKWEHKTTENSNVEWYTDDPEQGLTFDEDILVLLRG